MIFFIQKPISALDFTYPSAITISNGNIFVIEKEGIFVYDEQLANIVYNYPFDEDEKINDLNSLSNIIIKYRYDYIICLINLKIYFFSNEGEKLLETEKLITDENFSYPTLTPINLNDEDYYYIIGFFLNENNLYKLKLIFYKINLSSSDYLNAKIFENTIDKFTISFWNNIRLFQNIGLSCEYMQAEDNESDNFLTCFFIIEIKNSLTLAHYLFDVSAISFNVSEKYYYAYIDNIDDVKQIKAVTNNNRKEALVCLLYTNENLNCFKFHFLRGLIRKKSEFYQEIKTDFNCRNELYGMKLDFLVEPANIILSCIGQNALVQAIIFDDELGSQGSIFQFEECEAIFGQSMIYSKSNSDYYIISDAVCNDNKKCFEQSEFSPVQEEDIITEDHLEEKEKELEKEKEKENGKESERDNEKEKGKLKERENEREKEKESVKEKESEKDKFIEKEKEKKMRKN